MDGQMARRRRNNRKKTGRFVAAGAAVRDRAAAEVPERSPAAGLVRKEKQKQKDNQKSPKQGEKTTTWLPLRCRPLVTRSESCTPKKTKTPPEFLSLVALKTCHMVARH